MTERVRRAFTAHFGEDRTRPKELEAGSEDFGIIPDLFGTPYCYWCFGAHDPAGWDAAEAAGTAGSDFPDCHSPYFAPLLDALDTGVEAMVVATLAWLGREES